jgi:cysteine synthase
MNLYDELVPITGPEAIETAQKLARMEGIFTGISGGASMAGALKVASWLHRSPYDRVGAVHAVP